MKWKGKAIAILLAISCCAAAFCGCSHDKNENVSSPSAPSEDLAEKSPESAEDLEGTTWAICDGVAFDQRDGKAVTGDLVADAVNNLTYQFQPNGKVILSQTGEDDQDGTFSLEDGVIRITIDQNTVNGTVRDGKITFVTEGSTLIFEQKTS